MPPLQLPQTSRRCLQNCVLSLDAVAENEVAWNCRVCGNFNLQEKVKEQKSLKSRRLGTKENSENIKILIQTRGRVHEHYVVEFKHLKHGNHCWKCSTPMDYKPRKCAAEFFHPLNDYSEQLQQTKALPGATTTEDGNVDIEAPPPPQEDSKRRIRGRDSVLIFENKSIADALQSSQLGPIDKARIVFSKVKKKYQRFVKSEPEQNQVLYNDHTFKERLREFMPFVERRVLEKGEKYKIGDEVEAIERKSVWFPGVIKRAGANGTYDIIYKNGELVETVLPVKIRYPQTYRLSAVSRFILLEFLVIAVVSPYTASRLYSQRHPTWSGQRLGKGPIEDNYYTDIMLPFAAAVSLTVIVIVFNFWSNFMRTAQAGIRSHFFLLLHTLLPHAFGVAFIYVLNEKMFKPQTSAKWFYASIMQVFWSLTISSQFKQVNYFMGTCCYMLSFPFTIFSVMLGITMDQCFAEEDGSESPCMEPAQPYSLCGASAPCHKSPLNPLIVYGPAMLFALMLLPIRVFIPYVRSAKFY